MDARHRTTWFGIGAAFALLGSGLVTGVAIPSSVGAASGSVTWTCEGADDDKGAFVASGVGSMTSKSALGYANVGIEPVTMPYVATDLPAWVNTGSAALPIDAELTLPAGSNAQLGEGPLSFFDLSSVTYDPQIMEIVNDGGSALAGLSNSTTGNLDFANPTAAIHTLNGSFNPTVAGSNQLRFHQRITFLIDRSITYQGFDVEANTLTFDCTSDPFASIFVADPGAPIANPDSATLTLSESASTNTPVSVDVLANDLPSDPARPIDPATLKVTDNPGGLTYEVVDGSIVLTGPADTSAFSSNPECEWGNSLITTTTNPDGTETYQESLDLVCQASLAYEVCSVGEPIACSPGVVHVDLTLTTYFDYEDFTTTTTGGIGDTGSTEDLASGTLPVPVPNVEAVPLTSPAKPAVARPKFTG